MRLYRIVLCFLLASSTPAWAGLLYTAWERDGTAPAYGDTITGRSFILASDDRSGMVVQISIGSDGRHYCAYACTPDGSRIAAADLSLPISASSDVMRFTLPDRATPPGTDLGIGLRDAAGHEIRCRTPIDRAQASGLEAVWRSMVVRAPALGEAFRTGRSMAAKLFAGLTQSYRGTLASDERWKADLVGRYMAWRYGTGAPDGGEDAPSMLARDRAAIETLLLSRSTVIVVGMLSSGNGRLLILAPSLPGLSDEASVVDADGRTLWCGLVDGRVTVDLGTEPVDRCRVIATGLPLPIEPAR